MSSLKEERAEKKLLKIIKYDANANVTLGLKYISEEDYDSAIMCFTQAIKLNSNFFEAYNNRGVCYLTLKKNDLALADFNKAIKIKPSHPDAYINRINCYQAQENQEMALADYNKVIELKPNDAESYKLRGFLYTIQKKYELALSDFNKSEQLDYRVKDVAFYSGRALCYSNLKINELALEDFNKAIELDSDYSEHYINRGIHYLGLENYELALKDFNKAIILDENDPLGYINRGLCYSKLTNDNLYKLALTDYNKTIQLNPNIFETYYNIALCYLELDEYEKSLEYLNKSIEINPNDYDNYHDRGLCYFKLENYDLALIDFKKTIDLKNSYVETYLDIGNCYYGLKEYDLALKSYNKSIQLNPNCAKSYNNRGLYYAEQKNYDLAINDLTKAIDFFESKEHKKNCCLSISNIFIAKKRYDDAREYVEQAFSYVSNEEQHKNVYLSNIKNTEELDKKNQELEEKEREQEDMMSMFAHKFRSPLDAIIYNTSHENNPKLYAEAAQTMRGLLDIFSIISTDDKILTNKIKTDNQGNGRLITVLDKTLNMILLHLLSVSGAEKIQQHYLAYAKAHSKIDQSVSYKTWCDDYFELEQQLQTEWEQSFSALLNQYAPLEQRLNWIEQHFFKLELIGFERDDIQFKDYAITESFLIILINEILVNAFKYYSSETKRSVILQWIERDGYQVLSCHNPSIRHERTTIKGSGKGHIFLSALARKTGSQFTKPKPQDDFVLDFAIPNELLISNSGK